LRHCATNRNVAGSIPDCVTGIFHWYNRFGRKMSYMFSSFTLVVYLCWYWNGLTEQRSVLERDLLLS
jgi:uncharacterized protein YodC (DUF2158 family)